MTVRHNKPQRTPRETADGGPVEVAAAPVEPVSTVPQSPEFAMTRRELRELRKKAEASGGVLPEVVRSANGSYALTGSITVVPGPDAEDPVHEDPAGESPADQSQSVPDAASPQVHPISDLRVAHAGAASESDTPPDGETVEPQPERLIPFDTLFLPGTTGGTDGPDPAQLIAEALSGDRGVEPAPDSGAYGHWTAQTLDDESGDTLASRADIINPATGAITTQALVLPSMPSSGENSISVADGNTGEFMITGTVDLPRSFGSTGMHPAVFDHPDVDALIERSDPDEAVPESSPVRAVDSVSNAASARGLVIAPAPRTARLPLIAAITLGSMLLVGIGIGAAGFIFNVF